MNDLTPEELEACLIGLAAVLNEQGKDWAFFSTNILNRIDRIKVLADIDKQMATTRNAIVKLRVAKAKEEA